MCDYDLISIGRAPSLIVVGTGEKPVGRFMKIKVIGLAILALGFWSAVGADVAADEVRSLLDAPILPGSGLPCPAPESYSRSRPGPPGMPTAVGLNMMIQDISRFSDVDQTMTLDLYVMMRWHDPRLADPDRGEKSADCPVPDEDLWMPLIEPENLRSQKLFYPARFLVDASGTVTYVRRLLVEVANSLDLHDFPFDHHEFRITLWPSLSDAEEIEFFPLRERIALNNEISTHGWKVAVPVASARESERTGRIGRYYRYDVEIGMTRDWRNYAWKLGVPLILIVLMAYTVYFIPPSSVAQQVGVGMTSMLTLIAYMLALNGSLPKIPYLTRADTLFVGCAMLVFLGLLKAILTTVWVQKEAHSTIAQIDRIGRWLYPILLLSVVVVALI